MASCVALVSVMGAMPCSAPTSFIRGARQTPGPRHAAAERRSGGVRARKAAVRRCVAADGKGGDVSASVWSSTVNDDVDSDNTNREEGLRSVAGRRQTMAASIAVSVGVFGALGARSAWAASEPVDPATSPLVQGEQCSFFVILTLFLNFWNTCASMSGVRVQLRARDVRGLTRSSARVSSTHKQSCCAAPRRRRRRASRSGSTTITGATSRIISTSWIRDTTEKRSLKMTWWGRKL